MKKNARVYTPEEERELTKKALELQAQGMNQRSIADQLGTNQTKISNLLRKALIADVADGLLPEIPKIAEDEPRLNLADKHAVAPKRHDIRSSRDAAAEAANPENVAEIQELIGKFYGVEDVAAALNVTVRTVLQKLREGKLQGVKFGGSWKISARSLKRFSGGE